jgi:hypothetical protein
LIKRALGPGGLFAGTCLLLALVLFHGAYLYEGWLLFSQDGRSLRLVRGGLEYETRSARPSIRMPPGVMIPTPDPNDVLEVMRELEDKLVYSRLTWSPSVRGNPVFVPLWIPAVALLTFSAVWYRRSRPPKPGFCRCGYDLTGNVSGRCPECGRTVDLQSLNDPMRSTAACGSVPPGLAES